ncbi:hypothetical protein BGX27_001998 [Mortierella sp. AM989]|nr:hypothetical protein BGX27_001998 [Mortierella sp. AM989]
MDIESSVRSINICAWAVSATGSHALTFHQVGTAGYLNIWGLQSNSAPKETLNRPQIHSVPCAQAIIDLGDIHIAANEYMSVNSDISSTGSYAVVECPSTPEELTDNSSTGPYVVVEVPSTPEEKELNNRFHAFKWAPTVLADQKSPQPSPLQRIPTACDGESYMQLGFYNYEKSEKDKNEERFCTTDGRSFSIHSVQGNWSLLYKLEMQPESSMFSAYSPFESIQGRYFAWSHLTGAISIWDIDTGKLMSHIYTDDNQVGNFPALSHDGSMTAVTVNKAIQIYDTFTGIKLGVYEKGLPTDNYNNQVLFGQHHFMTRNTLEPTVKENQECEARSIVRVQDMSIVKSVRIHEDYKMGFRRNSRNPIFRYGFGSVLNVLQPGDLFATEASEEGCERNGVCVRESITPFSMVQNGEYELQNKAGKSFVLSVYAHISHNKVYLRIDVRADHGYGPILISIPLRHMNPEAIYQAIFFPCSSQLVLSTNGKIQVWKLDTNETRPCELSLVWRIGDFFAIDSGQACEHSFSLKCGIDAFSVENYTLTVPLSAQDTISIKEDVRLTQGISSLLDDFAGGDKTYKKEVIQYLISHLRPTPEHQESSLITLCKAWTVESKSDIEFIIHKLLPAGRITWIPDVSSTENSNDPLSIILKSAKTQSSAIYTAKIIMDYCVSHANRSRNLAFLNTFFRSLHRVMKLLPQEGILRLGRISHIPAMNRSHIMGNHIIAHPPNWKFWKQNSPLYKLKDPIMRLHISGSKPDHEDDFFTRPIFMASFDALWRYRDKERKEGAPMVIKEEANTTWWRILYHLILLNCRFRIHKFVVSYEFELEFHENPAVAALVAYKCRHIPLARVLAVPSEYISLYKLFELRVNESVCKYVTIIQNAVTEIRVFFIIFAVGIFAFTIATLHLLRACSYEGCEVPGPDKNLPENFLYAMSAIYFFMGGRWDPVSEVFTMGNWAFHVMMAIFFFFTVILTLNVLVALINKAFTAGGEGWRLVWVESRLRYIESAENLSYHIPGFRQTYDWFPKEIYFSSPLQKVQKFREKYPKAPKAEANLKALEEWINNRSKVDNYPEEKQEKSEEGKKNQDEEASSDDEVENLDVANPISDSKGGDTSEKIENTGKGGATSSSTTTITKISSQIVDLKSQIGDLQRQLAEQRAAQRVAQQEQVRRQQDRMLQKQMQQQQELMQRQQEQMQRQQEQMQRQQELEQAQQQHEHEQTQIQNEQMWRQQEQVQRQQEQIQRRQEHEQAQQQQEQVQRQLEEIKNLLSLLRQE